MKKLRGFFLIIYLCITVILFLTFNAALLVWLSFFINAILLFLIMVFHLFYEKGYSPFLSSYIVFTFLFFLVAPIVQIDSFIGLQEAKFVTNFPYSQSLVIYANFIIFIFNLVFITFYIQLKKAKKITTKKITNYQKKVLPFIILVLVAFSIFISLISFGFIIEEITRPNWLKSKTSTFLLLMWKKFLFFIPLAGIILCFQYFRNGIKNKNNYINVIIFLILLLILLFWFKNPLTEKRNALGPIYITLIFLFIPKLLNSNIKTLSFLFFSMIIIFPLTAILTHSDATFLEMYRNPSILIDQMKGGGIVNAFTSLNYDAFANNAATIELVHTQGFSYGYQLLGGVFFFIPRSIWTIKPFSSGEMIGEYLVNNYGYGFTNLSNSFVSEGFLNFGILGVVLFAIILAFVIVKFISWLNCDNLLKKMMAFYFSIHLIFFLRGDFTNGFSYYIGPLLAVVLIPKLIEIFTKELAPSKKNDWK